MIYQELAQEQIATKPEPLKRYATIKEKISESMFKVEDDQGRKYNVESTTLWQIGDSVTIMNNRIVGRARKFISTKIFKL